MNKINISIVIMVLILFSSCKNESENKEYTILSGKIKNTTAKELIIKSIDGFSKNIKIDKNGSFLDTLQVESGVFALSTGYNYTSLYFKKGDKMTLMIDDKNADSTFVFSGDQADLNNYYVNKAKIEKDFSGKSSDFLALDEALFEVEMNKHQKELEQNLQAYKNISEDLKTIELRSLNYGRLFKKMLYKDFHGKVIKNEEFLTSADFNKEIDGMDINSTDDYFYSGDYRSIVNRTISDKAYESFKKDSIPYEKAYLKFTSEIKSEGIKNELLYDNIQSSLSFSTTKKQDLDKYLSISTNKKHNQQIQELYNTVSKLDKGKPSPNFKNYENYEGGTTSLEDLRGKYVYIDVWATWCGPCVAEIPSLQKLEEEYKGKNIVFVSISVDTQKNKNKWKEMVKKKGMTGIQLIADHETNTEFITGYVINSIPRFIILDPKGNILDAHAMRPSDEESIKTFFKGLNLVNL